MTATFFPYETIRMPPFMVPFDFSAIRDALSNEAAVVANEQEDAWRHFISSVSLPREMFGNLVKSWDFDTGTSSYIEEIISNQSFRGIIGLGPIAIPLILEELAAQPSFLFVALEEISGVNPVKPEHRGDIAAMTQDWLDWGRQRGYL